MLRSPIDGQIYSSVADDGVADDSDGGTMAAFPVISSVAKGVDGSDETSSEFVSGNSAPSSMSLNFATAVSFSSLIYLK